MRMQYHEEKRRVYTLQLEDSLKRGMIEAVKNEESLPSIANRTMGGTQHFNSSMQKSPRTAVNKHTMDFQYDRNTRSPSALAQPEITLRDPLDKEFALNRKMAKKYYQHSLREKMSENKDMSVADREKWRKELHDKETQKEKAIAELRKIEEADLNHRVTTRKTKEHERVKLRQHQNRVNTNRILREAREEEKQRVERDKKKTIDYNSKLEEQFKRDKLNREEVANKKDQASLELAKQEQIISTKLVETEHTTSQKLVLKE